MDGQTGCAEVVGGEGGRFNVFGIFTALNWTVDSMDFLYFCVCELMLQLGDE